MATYTVYVPYSVAGATPRADRTVFVREGFSLAAFVFGPLYLIYRRLWVAALGWAAAAGLLGVAAHALAFPAPLQGALFVLLAWLTGLEASVLLQFGLRRRGYYLAALLASPSLEQAERGFFNGEGLRETPPRAPVAQGWSPRQALDHEIAARPPEVIGSLSPLGDA